MGEFREQVALPSNSDVSEPASGAFMGRLAAGFAAGLERSVGPVHWREGDTTVVDWTAEGFVDNALVVLSLRPSSREVSVLVNPGFLPPPSAEKAKGGILLLLGALAVAVVVGALKRSVGSGLVSFLSLVGASICADIVRQQLRLRRARAAFDPAAWRRRFHEALAAAVTPDRA